MTDPSDFTLFGMRTDTTPRRFPVGEHAPGLARTDHPDTARNAALAVTPRSGTQRRRVLDHITARPSTDEEIQTALAMSGNTERPRRVELVDGGFIVDSGERRPTVGGGMSIVWRANEARST